MIYHTHQWSVILFSYSLDKARQADGSEHHLIPLTVGTCKILLKNLQSSQYYHISAPTC